MTKIETLGPFQKTFVLINYGQMAPPNLWNVQILGRRLRKKLAIVKNPEVFEIKASSVLLPFSIWPYQIQSYLPTSKS